MFMSLVRPSPMANIFKEFVVEDSIDERENTPLRIATRQIWQTHAGSPARSDLTSCTTGFNWPKKKPGFGNRLGLFYSGKLSLRSQASQALQRYQA